MRIACVALLLVGCGGCGNTIEYQVTTALPTSSTARLVFDGELYSEYTQTFEVSDYAALRDAASTVTVRSNAVETMVVLPFAASECGSASWVHPGELEAITVHYMIYATTPTMFTAYMDTLTCVDSEGETHVVDR